MRGRGDPVTARRAFIGTLAGGLLAAPFAAGAQRTGRIYRIGVFHVGDHIPPGLETLRDGLIVFLCV